MRLLVVTQALDLDDPVLSVYHAWVEALSAHVDALEVICLKEGRHHLPRNVRVYSLGKERGSVPALVYATRFMSFAWTLRSRYDRVLVHMNQEYILIAGILWKLLGKRIYLWRNHYAGSWLTDLAALFCTHVFCTSKHSYTARYKKTMYMPVGVDTARFSESASVNRIPHSILFFARIARSKRPEMFIDALSILHEQGISFTASLYGSPAEGEYAFYEELLELVRVRGLEKQIHFFPGVSNTQAPALYQAHDIFMNCSPSGMYDKTLFEAAASGCMILTTSEDFKDLVGEDFYGATSTELARKLSAYFALDQQARETQTNALQVAASNNALKPLMQALSEVLTK